ncbi:MAG: GtrA family protein [Candidatus Thiothrix putei]|uniref:GtrA family protein n=1 Tax=Candidatus Thiothrix putei TaxID=3080811 RepID=A0AA95HER4_9GAMM|nr:MAG: GtrA family protein [Candidatus Thiothrix putei]
MLKSKLFAQVIRFFSVGIVNTIIGYAVIFGGMMLGMSPYMANILGYTVGLMCSFLLNKMFVFSVGNRFVMQQFRRFLIVFAVAYLCNLIVLHVSLQIGFGDIVSQVIAGVVYSSAFFLLSHLWVFR